MANLFLGLDSSTQSLSAVLIDYDTRKVVYEKSLNFDQALPKYGTRNGVLPHRDPLVKHSDPLLWAEALDQLFAAMKKEKAPLGDIRAISGSGQQHGSVYLNARAVPVLARLGSARNLVSALRGVFSRSTSPIWMDSSTAVECSEIRDALGGIRKMVETTGSDAFERFTGPQIRKFFKQEPKAYAATRHIALVSSFMASLLAGKIAPIDPGDGAGMNLMDIRKKRWHPKALNATAPRLKAKLPPIADSSRLIGRVSPYFVKRYGVNPAAQIQVWSGDNPCSVAGLGLVTPGQVAISLGTSDTYFGSMKRCRTDAKGEGHVFGSPTGDYMTLICFKNGSLAREKVRERYGIKSWEDFGKALARTPPGTNGGILLPWFEAEIVPRVNQPGVHRFDLDEHDAAAHCRAIMEAQMMSMRLHSEWMKVKPESIYATGGASSNLPLLQIMADVMNCRVLRIEIPKSAALGAALRAAHGWLRAAGKRVSWKQVVRGFVDPIEGSDIRPNPKAVKVYRGLLAKYARCEQQALKDLRQGAESRVQRKGR
jgi:xylulokinase